MGADDSFEQKAEATRNLLLIRGLILISFYSTNFSTLASTKQDHTLQATNTVDQKFKEASTMVREAEAAGAESSQIKDFVEKLNLALNLTDEAEAATIFDQVKTEASQLRDTASQASFTRKVFIFTMAQAAALTVTICLHYGSQFLRRNKIEKTMKMKIKEKGKAKHD